MQKAIASAKIKRPDKTYVVARKGQPAGSSKVSFGTKIVDRRMKADKRGEKAAQKRGAKGKKRRR